MEFGSLAGEESSCWLFISSVFCVSIACDIEQLFGWGDWLRSKINQALPYRLHVLLTTAVLLDADEIHDVLSPLQAFMALVDRPTNVFGGNFREIRAI